MTALQQKPKHLPTVPEVTPSDQEQEDDEDSAEQHTDHEEVDTATDTQPILVILAYQLNYTVIQ